ncbi:putative 2-aminoethylphosphonate ABC transporter ATP-binding protein [Jeongeupia naejangsanensis]|uniref:2-aminoethylphosphonate ABC transporter ATP-binding protein n=1 Tax=Jeongeupia naejangsanensis TaxID=613195 RepID=A0ABS2BII1_9NEIS|nr:putative 2-aminoethylphosphonate ABC transporter ATP-binding protein [Jeongeupia naejangsanensis]MBM3115404.1 putative 2-aminoethylphosphonate ABC transporter ATP-binding protein [Jeongeupia naejangsanensis]
MNRDWQATGAVIDALRVERVAKRFGAFTALDGVSLSVKKGEFLCLLGPSGCGKTTLLRIIAGLEAASDGALFMAAGDAERDVTRLPASQRDYGIVFQSYALFPNLNVAQNIAYGLKGRREDKDLRVTALLAQIGLPGIEHKYPSQLSGGQQQRVALARALATSPSLLLLDEPLSALDARVREHLRREIKSLQQKLGVTTVMVTHDQEEALTMADRIVVMNHGVIEQIGTPEEIYTRPANRFVAEFVGQSNWLAATSAGIGQVLLGDALLGATVTPPRPDGHPLELFIRPEDVQLHASWSPVEAQIVNTALAHVRKIELLGGFYRIALSVPGWGGQQLLADVVRSEFERLNLSLERMVPVSLPANRLRAFGPSTGAAA